MKEIDLKKLADTMPCKWRVQHTKNGKCICVPYIDARQAQTRLDEVCGVEGWQSKHHEVKGNLFCEVGINTSVGWIWKSDVGKESNIEKEKGESSDSFKRACVMWGIGRFLYEKQPRIIEARKYENNGKMYPYSPEKKSLIFDNETLTKYINWLEEKEAQAKAKQKKEQDKIKSMPQYEGA